MKKILTYAALAAISLAFVGCNREFDALEKMGEEGISLSLFCLDPVQTKAVPAATEIENKIESLEYFFFKGEDASKPALRKRVTNPSFTNNVYSINFTADGKAADFNNVTLNDLFSSDGKSEFFVVVNAREIGEKSLTAVKNTAAELSFATLRQNDPDNTGYDAVYTTPFVMTGAITLQLGDLTKDVELKRLAAKMTFDVNVAKKIEKPKTVDGAQVTETWRPILAGNNVRIFPSNVAFNAVLGGIDVAEPTTIDNYNPEHFRVGNAEIKGNPVDGYTVDGYTLETVESSWALPTSPAFYTYPRTWEAGEKTEPYIKLIVPWMMERKDANGNVIYSTQKELYYKVMLTDLEFVSNGWYNYTIDVDVLGNEADDPVVIIPAAYVVEDWNTVLLNRINSVMTEAMFLSVDKKEVTFYTAASPNVTVTASDAVTPYIVSITQKNLLTGQSDYVLVEDDAAGDDIGRYNTTLDNIQTNWVKLAGSGGSYTLEIEHALNNDITSDSFDATEYTFVVKLLLEGDTAEKYAKTVTFTQIPQIYVKEDPNRGLNSGTTNVANGGVYLNSYTIGDDFIDGTITRLPYTIQGRTNYYDLEEPIPRYNNYLGGVHGLTGNNKNPNMYVLTISISDKYNIGDPRGNVSIPSFTYPEATSLAVSGNQWTGYYISGINYTNRSGAWVNTAWTEDGNHSLTYYHPTSSDNTANMIAPKIRVASSYGVCTIGISESNAIARCAAYQEDGIPAGRWRLPTMAEVQFISTLSAKGRIPYLFGSSNATTGAAVDDDSYYWTANGLIHVNNGSNPPVAEKYTGNNSPGGESVRCVYDEWFWGDAMKTRPVAYNQFTWGDEAY